MLFDVIAGKGVFENIDDSYGIMLSLRNLGHIAQRENKIDEAQHFYENIIQISEKINPNFSALGINALGFLSLQRRDYNQARIHFESALEIFDKTGDDTMYAQTLAGLGVVASRQGDRIKAKQLFYQSLDIAQKINRRDQIAYILYQLAMEEEKSNNFAFALKLAKESNENYERLGCKEEFEKTKELISRLEKNIK